MSPTAQAFGPTRPERVAVIAIHGVADQKSGDTARAVASLLVNAGGDQVRYSEGVCDSVILAVPPLSPMVSAPAAEAVGAKPVNPVEKALRQSVRSDFQRDQWSTSATASDEGADAQSKRDQLPETPTKARPDPGLAFSDYLLFKAERNGAHEEAYEATRIKLTRRPERGALQHVDVHEMYWADLSRLSGTLPRIVTELFTMIFRLSRLGRDVVDEAARVAGERHGSDSPAARRWKWLAVVQIALDWAFASVLANLFLQLLLVGMFIALLGMIAPHVDVARNAVAWIAPALAAWWICYHALRENPGLCLAAVVAAGAAVWALHQLAPVWVVAIALLSLLALLCDYGLRVAEVRFPAARATGLVLLAATFLALLGHVTAADSLTANRTADLHDWLRAGMRVVEYLLLLIVLWWAVAAAALALWIVLGELVARESPAARSSVATGRLGLFVSIASFLAVSMVLWAVVTRPVELGATGTDYQPLIFSVSDGNPSVLGDTFLRHRYEKSTEAFAVVTGLTLLFLLYVVVVFVPSVLAEVKRTIGTPQALGRWLSAGYRRLEGFVRLIAILSVVFAVIIGTLLLLARFDVVPVGWLGTWSQRIADLSRDVLKPLVLGTATAAAAFSVFGGLLSRYAPGFRAPLDLALDVDNHFREFPRRAIPRARIFSRYMALLEHVVAQEYDRVVIVAHSQGTVISAEFLRYLKFRAQALAADGSTDRVTQLWPQLKHVDILTAGCPLRQLYAARFPELYAWVRSGPAADDIGVRRWINVYTSGDYVGRWLWCDPPPAYDTVDGKATLYDTSNVPASAALGVRDVCLGSGAHTHYFEPTERRVASWIDALVRHPNPA